VQLIRGIRGDWFFRRWADADGEEWAIPCTAFQREVASIYSRDKSSSLEVVATGHVCDTCGFSSVIFDGHSGAVFGIVVALALQPRNVELSAFSCGVLIGAFLFLSSPPTLTVFFFDPLFLIIVD